MNIIIPRSGLLNDPHLFSRYTKSADPTLHHSQCIPRIQILDILTIHIWASAAQYYGSLKPNKQPFNQQNGPLFYPKAFYHHWLEHPREPVGITH